MTEDKTPAFINGGFGRQFAVCEIVFCLGENPGVLHGGPPDHDTGDGGGLFSFFENLGRIDVAVSDDRDRDMAGAFIDDVPVGLAPIGLGAGAAMNSDSLNSTIFEEVADFGGIDGLLVPSDTDFSGDGDLVADGLDDFTRGIGEERAVPKERRTTISGDDFVDGAAEVEIDKVGLFPVDDFLGGFSHPLAIGTKQLDAYRALFVGKGGVSAGAVIRLKNAFGRDEFGHHDIGSELLAEGAESDIGHACHRCQVNRKLVFKPREHLFLF